MNILFIHGNYPAQFRYLAPLLGQDKNHNVIFMTNRQDSDKEKLPGVKVISIDSFRQVSKDIHHYLVSTEESVLQGQAVIRTIISLIESGFIPDIVIYHAGMGFGLFTKELLPKAIHIGYFEWYFRKETTKFLVKDFDFDTQLKTSMRNVPILNELENCDFAIVPTEWQKKQFPKEYQDKIRVIFDGVDGKFFYPNPDFRDKERIEIENRESKEKFVIGKHEKVLSYATRGMEPLRGFPEFMKSLPSILNKDRTVRVVIAGIDRRAYSYDAPTHNGSWKEFLINELGDELELNRIYFTGLLDYNDYRKLLWRSNLHCYFTRPYVTSWSLFEAAACGAKLAMNRSEAVEHIVENESVTWIDIDNLETMSSQLFETLTGENPKSSKILEGYYLDESMNKWEKFLNQCIQTKRHRRNYRDT